MSTILRRVDIVNCLGGCVTTTTQLKAGKEEVMNSKVWFITGASRGLGRVWAEAALTRGDKVVASARKAEDVAELKEKFGDAVLPLALDVTSTEQAQAAVQQAFEHFGRLDIVLNNAGYSLVGTVEEATESDVRALFEANYFGTLRVIKAALPCCEIKVVGTSSASRAPSASLPCR